MNFKKLILYSSVFSIQGLSNAAIPVLPELAGGVGDSVVSNLLFSGYFVGALLALVPFGILADRIGNLKVIVFGVLLTALSGLVISFSDSLWILVIARFLEGVGCGAFFPAAFSMLAGWKDSQRSLGEFNFLLNAGLAAGVFLSGMLAGFGIKTAIGIFTLLASLSCIFLLSKIGELLSSGRKEKRFALRNSNDSVESQKDTSLLFELGKYLNESRETILKSSFGKIWVVSVLLYGTTGFLTANYPDYSAGFLTKPELGLAISASYLAAMLSSLMVGRAKVNSENIVKAGIILASAGILLSLKVPILAFSLIGAGGGIAVVGLITAVSKINSSGFAMGFFNTGIYAGLGLGPVFGSFFLEPFGYEIVFLGSALLLLTTLFVKIE
ncbi:MAG: MFS transporter [Methanosarcina sp.]